MKDDPGTLIEPTPVTFTWGAPGWYVLAALLILTFFVIAYFFLQRRKKNRYRREALSWLALREQQLDGTRSEVLVYDATMLLKRIVMARYGRPHAAVSDKQWMQFMNSASRTPVFADVDAEWLARVLYTPGQPPSDSDVQNYLAKTKKWIKKHRYAL